MSTVQLAKWAADRLNAYPEDAPVDDEQVYVSDHNVEVSVYLGSTLSLDPCGRAHHLLSPNGVTSRCEQYWEVLEQQLEKRGLCLAGGDGDGCDNFAVRVLRDATDEDKRRQAAA